MSYLKYCKEQKYSEAPDVIGNEHDRHDFAMCVEEAETLEEVKEAISFFFTPFYYPNLRIQPKC